MKFVSHISPFQCEGTEDGGWVLGDTASPLPSTMTDSEHRITISGINSKGLEKLQIIKGYEWILRFAEYLTK